MYPMSRFRFSIRRLMILVAGSAWVSWLIASIVRLQGFGIAMAYFTVLVGIAIAPWAALRGRRRLAWWIFVGAAVFEFAVMATMGVVWVNSYRMIAKMIFSSCLLPIAAGAGAAWAGSVTTPVPGRRRPRVAAWSLVALLVVVPASMLFSSWPMKAAVLASRPALERLADRVAAGEKLSRPEWAGLFLVRKANRSTEGPGYVGLIIDVHCWLIRIDTAQAGASSVPLPAYDPKPLGSDGRWWFGEYF
jgi:hypothetical protein